MAKSPHGFGGPWTEEKLDRVTQYLQSYTKALKKQPFQLMYIDALPVPAIELPNRTVTRRAASFRFQR